MKKVMLFVISMLFAVSASAASMDVTGVAGTNSFVTGEFDAVTPSFASVDFRSVDVGAFDQSVTLVVDTDGDYRTEWGFNPGFAVTSPTFSGAATSGIAVVSLIAGQVYTFMVSGLNSIGGMRTDFTVSAVSAVPVPAALFLFAPAILGFFGLRRKAA